MALIPKHYIDSVVSIGIRREDKSIAWIGTGFFVHRRINENTVLPFLVSNKHVLEHNPNVVIRMKEMTKDQLIEIDLKIEGLKCHPHADIAAVKLPGSYIEQNHLNFKSFDVDTDSYSSIELRDNGADEGSLVYMLGFPMGLVNVNSGLPICRMGCIARISEEQIQESGDVLLDIQNFPGNSGSPVVNRVEAIAIEGTKALGRCVLIGIIHAYIPYQEQLVNMQTQNVVEIRSENSGIALMHPVEFIREVIDLFYKKQ